MNEDDEIYKRIGEFVVSFQWIENKLREIGWFILDPSREDWPPKGLRNLSNQKLIDKVHALFIEAITKCNLPEDLENEFKESFSVYVTSMHKFRKDRNRILHSAFIELKGGGEVQGLIRSNPKLQMDEETGESLFDQEILTGSSFEKEMKQMAEADLFLNRAYMQLIHRYQNYNA
ncbi:hypothetical protein P886_0258 [Alteromonadaceae bacterium 2753L.S.0a.02]|nr:hypothetical protein P886_0258 [Alteromonadaceae bacterium 2753L.S.0a.02]